MKINTTNPKISIVTVVLNCEKYIEQSVQSVLAQDYNNIEYIMIDGGSTDNTLKILEPYKSSIHTFLSEADEGLSDAMNKGARLSSGVWVLFLHADDILSSKYSVSEIMSIVINEKLTSWVTGYLNFIDSKSNIIKKDTFYDIAFRRMLIRNIIRHQATIVKKEDILKIGFSEKYKYAMDYDFFLRLWRYRGKPVVIQSHLTNFRLDGDNLSSDYYASLKDEMRVRLDYRKLNSQKYLIPFDYLIYLARYLKIFLYHSRKNNVR